MAPPVFPNGMTLYSIGFAALEYPKLPPLGIPITNQLGVLQSIPPQSQNHMIAQLASQFLPAMLEYQSSNDAVLNDRSSPQFYASSVLLLLNFMNVSPDVCARIIEKETILHNIVEKLLEPNFEDAMKACKRPALAPPIPAPEFKDDFGSLLQFVSTMMLHTDWQTIHPRFEELTPKLKEWKRKQEYRGTFIATVCDRIVSQMDMPLQMVTMMRSLQKESLVCGAASCGIHENLTACGACKLQRYCGREHQRADWKYHKNICNKGLVEPSA